MILTVVPKHEIGLCNPYWTSWCQSLFLNFVCIINILFNKFIDSSSLKLIIWPKSFANEFELNVWLILV